MTKPARTAKPKAIAKPKAVAKPAKKDFPVSDVRRFLEPGPIVLVSSAYKDEMNVMTLGWHLVLGFEPSLVGCYLWDANHSYELIRMSKECVINLPTVDLAEAVVGVGNCSGRSENKFAKFGLTAAPAEKVKAPLIAECHANFECRLADASQIKRLGLFVFEVVKAHVAERPKFPKTLHYRGDGLFMLSGPTTAKYRQDFKPQNL